MHSKKFPRAQGSGNQISQETLADWLRHGAQVVLQEGAHQVSGRSGDLAQVESRVAGAIR